MRSSSYASCEFMQRSCCRVDSACKICILPRDNLQGYILKWDQGGLGHTHPLCSMVKPLLFPFEEHVGNHRCDLSFFLGFARRAAQQLNVPEPLEWDDVIVCQDTRSHDVEDRIHPIPLQALH